MFFQLPDSPARARFRHYTEELAASASPTPTAFTGADIQGLPLPVQRYFRYCGYIGAPKMAYMRASLKAVDFVMSPGKTIRIDYEQFNLVERPERYALISSSLLGIPFEGLDSYKNGEGAMEGRLGKVIPLFDQRGESMDRSCLVTWLAECLMAPAAALQDFVTWEPMDETHARAAVSWKGLSAGGVFRFSQEGELLEFTTEDRAAIDMNGKETNARWSARFLAYHRANGLLQPGSIQSVWHYPAGDCIYFNQNQAAFALAY